MLDWLLVLPGIDEELTVTCMASMRLPRERVIVVDNAPQRMSLPWEPREVVWENRNLGVSRSWNEGAVRVVRENRDMLIICSQTILFGEAGGLDLVGSLDATDGWGLEVAGAGWHLVCLTRQTLETIGPFDEGFYPGYFEDTCCLYRMGLAGLPSPRENGRHWPYVVCDYASRGDALSIHKGLVQPAWAHLADRYAQKWGGPCGHETYTSPWNSGKPLWWWPGSRYAEVDPWQTWQRQEPT